MSNIHLPYLGTINLNSTEDDLYLKADFEGKEITIDIHPAETGLDEAAVLLLEKTLNNLPEMTKIAWEAIQKSFLEKGDAFEYCKFISGALEPKELENYLIKADKTLSIEEQMFSIIELKRTGFYLQKSNFQAIFDYNYDRTQLSYYIVTYLNHKNEVTNVTMES
jgi:hypothetical protein